MFDYKKDDILKHFSDNLQAKYRKNTNARNPNDFLEKNIKRKLSDEQKNRLDAPLTKQELYVALMSMQKGKTPGTNGFTSEFFKHFWSLLGAFLYRASHEGLNNKSLLLSHRESIVTLIPKQGKPKDSVKGWRPISLLNVDFKIISSAVSNRMKAVIHDLISSTQTAYIPGRFIGENSRLVYDVIEHMNISSTSGIIMAVDFEAAFDTVSWDFLINALHYYNFGPNYIQMIETMYLNSNNFSRIILDGFLGQKITMEKGIRQGDPISGLLFNLVMEPLANQILQSNDIKGLPITNVSEVRLSQYADDLIIFSHASLCPIRAVLRELKEFSEVSGLQINVDKTKCLQIGNPIDISFINELGLKQVNELKVLGMLYNSTNENIVKQNIASVMPNINKEISQWKRRYLTLFGRITVIKSLIISKLVHVFTALPNPDAEDTKQINNIIFKYLWCGGPDKIKRTSIVQDYHRDGMKMIEINSFIKSLKISWIKRLYWASSDVTWAEYAKEKLPPISDLICFGATKLADISKNKLKNRFWRDVIDAWAELCRVLRPDSTHILTDKLWFSDHTKYKKSIVRSWDEKGLRFVADLFCKRSGAPLNRSELCETFKIKMNFLCHSSLIKSISTLNINNNEVQKIEYPIIPYKITLFSKSTNTSRLLYNAFVLAMNKQKTTLSVERKWQRDIGCMYEGTLKDIRRSTRNTYLQAFHYRIVKRIISTNTFLFKLGKCETPLCTFCSLVNETLYHILWECEVVQNFINEVMTFLKDTYNVIIQFKVDSWIFPRASEESLLNILIITMAKLVIFKSKYKNQPPNIQHFQSLLKLEVEKEEKCAKTTKSREKFMSKWGNVTKILSNCSQSAPLYTPSQSNAHQLSIHTSRSPSSISPQSGASVVVGRRQAPGGRSREAPAAEVSPARPVRCGPPFGAAVCAVAAAPPRPHRPRRPLAEAHPV